MAIDQIPLLSMIKGRLGYLSQRERLIAQNVANADTPGFMPKDLKPFTVQAGSGTQAGAGLAPVRTDPGHLGLGGRPGAQVRTYGPVDSPDSETTLDGNRVVLEDQMMKMTEARLDYDAAIGFYQKSMNLLRMAARPPGKS
jgi:flagellar basal-body rod protein FlgB